MGDDLFESIYDDWDYDKYENVLELQVISKLAAGISIADARRTLEAAVRKIPDSALKGNKSFRVRVTTAKKSY